jgi:hypothetical protein
MEEAKEPLTFTSFIICEKERNLVEELELKSKCSR